MIKRVGSNALLNGVHKESLLFRDVMYSSQLVDAMTKVIGPNIKAASNQLVYKHPGDTRPYDWHQDNGFGPLDPYTTVSCWMALDDVNENNGCLWVIPGSHKLGQLKHNEERGRERIVEVSDETGAIPVILRANAYSSTEIFCTNQTGILRIGFAVPSFSDMLMQTR